MINISALRKDNLSSAWNDIAPYIQKGLDYANNEMDLDDVHTMVEEGGVIPLIIDDGDDILSVITLELVNKPAKKILCIMTAGGSDLDKWLPEIMNVIYQIAKEQQADSISINGRKGWLRKLEQYNYKHLYTVLSCEVH